MDANRKISALRKLAFSWSGLNPFRDKTPQEIEQEKLDLVGQLYDVKRWGKGPHDKPVADDTQILSPSGEYNTETFSTSRQILPDASLKYLDDPGISWKIPKAFGAPDADQVADFARDPRDGIRFFLDHAPALPSSWSEWAPTIEDKIPSLAPDKYVTPITNSMHYAFQPILTGKAKYDRNSPDSDKLVNEIAKRMAYGMRRHMDVNSANMVSMASKRKTR